MSTTNADRQSSDTAEKAVKAKSGSRLSRWVVLVVVLILLKLWFTHGGRRIRESLFDNGNVSPIASPVQNLPATLDRKRQIRQDDFRPVTVVKVIDGDTLLVRTEDGDEITIDVYGIDAPELQQPFGQQAARHLTDLVKGKDIRIRERRELDTSYFRADVLVDDDELWHLLIRAGMAWYDLHPFHYDPEVVTHSMERPEPRSEKRGLWSGREQPVAPWQWRADNLTEEVPE